MDDPLEPVRYAAEQVRGWTTRRDRRIRTAVAEGATIRAVAEAAGMSPAGIHKIVRR